MMTTTADSTTVSNEAEAALATLEPHLAAMTVDELKSYCATGAHALVQAMRRTSLEGVRLGMALVELKSRFAHGEWLPYIEDELPIGADQVERLMYLARNSAHVRNLPEGLSVTEAVKAIRSTIAKQAYADRSSAAAATLAEAPPFSADVDICVANAAILDQLADDTIDLIITSPPYNLGLDYGAEVDDALPWNDYRTEVRRWVDAFERVLKPHGRACVVVPLDNGHPQVVSPFVDWYVIMRRRFQMLPSIVWHEGNVSRSTARGSEGASAPWVFSRSEMILVASKGAWKRDDTDRLSDLGHDEWLEWTTGDWKIPGTHSPLHPAVYPESLVERLVKLFSFVGDRVCDPFLGSGTTGVVAVRLGRDFSGSDTNPEYVTAAQSRLAFAQTVTV